jgi:allantoicase
VELFPETSLKGDSQNSFAVDNDGRFTHLRLKIYPDGGVARLRVHGVAVPDRHRVSQGVIDLVALENGGTVVTSSDEFYGAPRNLLMPYAAKNMGDGWETKRRRGPGHDWVILKLGVPGTIERIEVNTAHFKGNFPESCSIETFHSQATASHELAIDSVPWKEVLPRTKLKANARHIFRGSPDAHPATHVRFHIYPDGGVSRLRLFGKAENHSRGVSGFLKFHQLTVKESKKALLDCCGSAKWAEQMKRLLPFRNEEEMIAAAESIWSELSHKDWLEAFRRHPQIGSKKAQGGQSSTARKWSAGEQATALQASAETLVALAAANKAYAKKFGFVFLICATGMTSDEILRSLQQRIGHAPETELHIAAAEQNKITRIRLEKLFKS